MVTRSPWLALPVALFAVACDSKPPSPKPTSTEVKKTEPPKPPSPEELEKVDVALFSPAKVGEQGWQRTSTSPVEMAAKVDAALHNLKHVSWTYDLKANMPEGKTVSNGKGAILDQSRFHYDAVRFVPNGSMYADKVIVIADGVKVGENSAKGWTPQVPVAQSDRLGKDLVGRWIKTFPELLFAGLGNRRTPLTDYIRAVAKPGSGYEVFVDEKKPKDTVVYNRILVLRTPAAAKKLGVFEWEIQLSPRYFVPTTVRGHEELPGGKKRRVGVGYSWNLFPDQKIDESQFRFPASVAGPF